MMITKLPNIIKMYNNTFTDEVCWYCKKWFDACLNFIYVDKDDKSMYYCYNCGEMIMKEQFKEKVILT